MDDNSDILNQITDVATTGVGLYAAATQGASYNPTTKTITSASASKTSSWLWIAVIVVAVVVFIALLGKRR